MIYHPRYVIQSRPTRSGRGGGSEGKAPRRRAPLPRPCGCAGAAPTESWPSSAATCPAARGVVPGGLAGVAGRPRRLIAMTDWLMDGLFGWLGEKVVDLLSSLLAPTGTVAVPAPGRHRPAAGEVDRRQERADRQRLLHPRRHLRRHRRDGRRLGRDALRHQAAFPRLV